ncbi:hypothetical protein MAR_024500 [Mya arenaria]|uniref:Uncharacterized protein n=1 Tax=Mya arenaria TaxID=6604 RepID=A0ABY7DTY5_MYAAR|nr:hypothetical protein MAR_024500 [Mya arenaria]
MLLVYGVIEGNALLGPLGCTTDPVNEMICRSDLSSGRNKVLKDTDGTSEVASGENNLCCAQCKLLLRIIDQATLKVIAGIVKSGQVDVVFGLDGEAYHDSGCGMLRHGMTVLRKIPWIEAGKERP